MMIILLFWIQLAESQTCEKIKDDLWDIQKDIFRVEKEECLTSTTIVKPPSLTENYLCSDLSTIELKIASTEGQLANLRGIKRLKKHLDEKRAAYLKNDDLHKDFFKTDFPRFKDQIQLASLIENFIQEDEPKSKWDDIKNDKVISDKNKTTAEHKTQLLTLCDSGKLPPPFCSILKTTGFNDQITAQFLHFIWNHHDKPTEPYKNALKIKIDGKEKSFSDLQKLISEKGFDKDKKLNKEQYSFLQSIEFNPTSALSETFKNVELMANLKENQEGQHLEALKQELKDGFSAMTKRQVAQLKEKTSALKEDLGLVSPCLPKDLDKLQEQKNCLDKIKNNDSEAVFALKELLETTIASQEELGKCLDKPDTECKPAKLDEAKLTNELDYLSEILETHLKEPKRAKNIELKHYLHALLKSRSDCKNEFKIQSIDEFSCSLNGKKMDAIEELYLTNEKILVQHQNEQIKISKEKICKDKSSIEKRFQIYCEEKSTSSVGNTDAPEEDPDEAVTPTESPYEKKQRQQTNSAIAGAAAQQIAQSYFNARNQQQFLNQARRFAPQQSWYPNSPYNYNPFQNLPMSDRVLLSARWYGGYGNYYNLPVGSSSTGISNYFGMSPTNYQGLDYQFGTSSTSTIPTSVSQGMYNFDL